MIHLFYGNATHTRFSKFNRANQVIIYSEVVASGPVTLCQEQWPALRSQHLCDHFDADPKQVLQQQQSLQTALANLDPTEELVCWFGNDLYSQVAMLYLLAELGARGHTHTSIVSPPTSEEACTCFGDVPAAEFNLLLQQRTPVPGIEFQHAAIAWHLYCAPDPRAINAVLDGSIDVGRRFASLLEQHASRFPSTVDKLGVVERSVLSCLAQQSLSFSELFQQVSKRISHFGWSDLQVRNLCWRLCQSRPSLLDIPDAQSAAQVEHAEITLSSQGKAFLDGEPVAFDSPTYWIGGCELFERSWQWDAIGRRIVHDAVIH